MAPGWVRLAARLAPLAAAALAFLAFAPALRAGFVRFDDYELFVDNPAYRGLDAGRLAWMFTTTHMGHYVPLTWLTHAVDYTLFGLDPHAFHRTNLLFHALNAVLFYLVSVRLLIAARTEDASRSPAALRLAALASALFFAVHPLRAETVAWITERRALVDTGFVLLALLAYLRACPAGRTGVASRGWYAASIVLLVLSFLSKGMAISFVAILVVLDVYPLRRLPGRPQAWISAAARPVWVQKAPFLVLGLASAAVGAWAQVSNTGNFENWGPLARIEQALFGIGFYIRKTLLPRDLAVLVEIPYRFDPLEPRFLLSSVAVLLAAVLVFRMRRRWPALAACSVIYVAVVSPVLGLFQQGPQLVADRYSYLACMPWAVLGGGLLLSAWSRWSSAFARAATGVAVATVVVALTLGARAQARTWLDSRTLWSHALDVGRASASAHVNLGAMDAQEGHAESAIAHFEAALALRPDQGRAWFNLGLLLTELGRYGEAERAYQQACRTMKPAYVPWINLGHLYRDHLDRIDDAIACYRTAVEDVDVPDPGLFSPVPYLVLGIALKSIGETEEARPYLEIAARHPSTREQARAQLGE